MPSYDEARAECWVFTYKQGLLSPMAHDLRLRVGRFRIELDEAEPRISASFDASSLYVDTAMRDGAESPEALSAADKNKIARQIREEVLHADAHPSISFHSTRLTARADGGYEVAGQLTLHGVTRPLLASTSLVGGRQQLELALHQPHFGIEPYRALLGALKIESDVRVRLVV